ncbi:Protein of unknown function [Reichenbachiella faecimaris]|uniref:DUF4056 domain-containing protein n=1 Tax=Reichenbachiella faecimaris TaxID=692418 RepID=A0A1W2GED7_REIFA|nr:DUF4056 domain-containing protein [Reichenbachiella faecimaris]SMD34616.1 Protein of unknown function [Reichenbachiella faecimaris]
MNKWIFTALWAMSMNALLAKAPILSDKQLANPPSKVIRICCAFGSDVSVGRIPFVKKNDILDIDALGKHKYLGGSSEGNGIIYTQKGGFVDLGHLRDYADWTAYLYAVMSADSLIDSVVLRLGIEGGTKTLTIHRALINNYTDKFELAGKIAYDLSVWHEISTWFGASYIPGFPEKFSSFSPEDLYSNLLGARIGILALKSDLEYEEAVTQILASTLKSLQAVDEIEETFLAMEEVENLWWTRKRALPNKKFLLKRYLQNDGELEPWLLPEDSQKQTGYALDVPEENLRKYYSLTIKLNSRFPVNRIFPFKKDRLVSQNDFDELVTFIEKESARLDLKYAKRQLAKNRRAAKKNTVG